MKTKEELNALRRECEALSQKLNELTEDELQSVMGGNNMIDIRKDFYENILLSFLKGETDSQMVAHTPPIEPNVM